MTATYAPRLTKPTTINFNDRVLIKMNPLGWEIHRKWHEDLFTLAGKLAFPYRRPEVGADGCVEFHLWEVAQIFGPHLSNGCKMPFETEAVIRPA
jgi:hypothetical protein